MQIRYLTEADWPTVKLIYESGLATGIATFQTEAPNWEHWDKGHLGHSRLVILDADQVFGWAALSPVSSRAVYRGVAEVSIYLAPDSRGKGIGLSLLQALIEESEKNGMWTLQAGIFEVNLASIRLHEKAGFRMVGYREHIGQLYGRWHNTVLMERRSATVGN